MADGTQRGAHYYNEFDPAVAAWLRNLIAADLIPAGDVDERSIEDVTSNDLRGYVQCHFFAGIAGWPLALRLARWPDSRPAWTGSCPCQPFSAAGKGAGFADERHLWPAWQHLIAQCRPPVVFGEQVAGAAVGPWIDLVHADLEGMGYAFGCIPFPAAGIGAPHIRDRTYWVAHAGSEGLQEQPGRRIESTRLASADGFGGWLADANGRNAGTERQQSSGQYRQQPKDGGAVWLADAEQRSSRREAAASDHQWKEADRPTNQRGGHSGAFVQRPGPTNGQWADADWLGCTDGKWRPIEPGTFPLLDGLPASLERLRSIEMAGWNEVIAYGNDNQANPDEVLRMVREAIRKGPSGKEQQLGVLQQLHAPEVLLNFLLSIEATRNGATDRSGGSKTCTEAQRRILRSVRESNRDGGSSHQWDANGQHAEQPSNALHKLSLVLARHASAYRQEARKAHAASGRVGMLRAYGNAIVPVQAAEFVLAYAEARGLIALEAAA